jgi:uncharacterized protein
MMGEDSAKIKHIKTRAISILQECGSVLVALSGGVDSAVLLSLAVEALGAEKVLAVTGSSPSMPGDDLEDARRVARSLGVAHEIVATEEMRREGYRANTGDRCYHCRATLFERLTALARERGMAAVAYGAIADDASDYRPGMRAAEESGILAPLMQAGIGKRAVRILAAQAGLNVRDKPAAACLASRIPLGTEVTARRLSQVGKAETALRALGFKQLRVRHHGEIARLELDEEGYRLLADRSLRERVVSCVREAGFRFVALDLEGYRTGSLNPPIT